MDGIFFSFSLVFFGRHRLLGQAKISWSTKSFRKGGGGRYKRRARPSSTLFTNIDPFLCSCFRFSDSTPRRRRKNQLTSDSMPLSTPGQVKETYSWHRLCTTKLQTVEGKNKKNSLVRYSSRVDIFFVQKGAHVVYILLVSSIDGGGGHF